MKPTLTLLLAVMAFVACSKQSTPVTAPVTKASPTPVPVAKPTSDATVADLVTAIAAGKAAKNTVCFAWSATTRRVACHEFTRSIQGGATFAIALRGDKTATSFTYFTAPEGQQFHGDHAPPDKVDAGKIAEVKAALAKDGYVALPAAATSLSPGKPGSVLGATITRTRTKTGSEGDPATGVWSKYAERFTVSCGKDTRKLELGGSFEHDVGEPVIEYRALADDLVLFTAAVSWAVEGDFGAGAEAQLMTKTALCAGTR